MMHFEILYGVSKSKINAKAFVPVVFVNGVSQWNPNYRAAKTAKGALNRAERWANGISEDKMHFNNTVNIVKWQHSVI